MNIRESIFHHNKRENEHSLERYTECKTTHTMMLQIVILLAIQSSVIKSQHVDASSTKLPLVTYTFRLNVECNEEHNECIIWDPDYANNSTYKYERVTEFFCEKIFDDMVNIGVNGLHIICNDAKFSVVNFTHPNGTVSQYTGGELNAVFTTPVKLDLELMQDYHYTLISNISSALPTEPTKLGMSSPTDMT
ncbi:unnamed protein product [Heterobilharzia americana]|nr:unnamed protein product [Heterobilharzia americana]